MIDRKDRNLFRIKSSRERHTMNCFDKHSFLVFSIFDGHWSLPVPVYNNKSYYFLTFLLFPLLYLNGPFLFQLPVPVLLNHWRGNEVV